MTVVVERQRRRARAPREHHEGPTGLLKWLTSTDHKVIGMNYMVTSLVMFFIGRAAWPWPSAHQLASPTSSLRQSYQTFNELFTMHGSLMLYLFAGPFAFGGLANYIVPLQVGAPDMAFPRLNALSYWLYLAASITMISGFLVAGGRGRLRLGGLRAAVGRHQLAGGRAPTCGSWPSA